MVLLASNLILPSSRVHSKTCRRSLRNPANLRKNYWAVALAVQSPKDTERGGFEPPIPLRAYQFSRLTHSTTLPPLQDFEGAYASAENKRCLCRQIFFGTDLIA